MRTPQPMPLPKPVVEKPRLNEGLCPDNFEICVPKACGLLEPWEEPGAWQSYLQSLIPTRTLPSPYSDDPPSCCTCDGKPGWKLCGELALAHACRVHDHIHRQFLSFEQVTAVDVGFAVWERKSAFGPFLSIRIHVNRKLPPERLFEKGLASFNEPAYILDGFGGRGGGRGGKRGGGRSGAHRQEALDYLLDPETLGDYFDLPLDNVEPPPTSPPGCSEPGHSPPETCLERHARPGHHCATTDRNLVNLGEPGEKCWPTPRSRRVYALLQRDMGSRKKLLWNLARYPIGGIHAEDFSIFCPLELSETHTVDDLRLCICGIPIDIINAEYKPSIHHAPGNHPGGDADSGTFVQAPRRSDELEDEETHFIGRGRVNPLVGGISAGSITGQAGTVSSIVWDRTDGTPCLLSNWHVLAGNVTAQVGQPTYQPALFDGGTEDDVVAHLKRWHLGEEGDAALAELSGSRHYASGEVLGLWRPISGYLQPKLGMKIRKWGRTTGFTEGFIDGIHLATNIDYGAGVVRYFRDQFHIAPLFKGQDVSQVGDSGSLVVTSLMPLDLKEKLATVVGWLCRCCDSHQLELVCKEISGPDVLPKLIAECRSRRPCDGLTLCNEVCNLLETVDVSSYCCTGGDPEELCEYLEGIQRRLRDQKRELECLAKYCRRFERFLEQFLEEYCESSFGDEAPVDKVASLAERLGQACVAGSELENALLEGSSSTCPPPGTDPCKWAEKWLHLVRAICECIEHCADLCTHAVEIFEGWQERLARIQSGQDFCERLCSALNIEWKSSKCFEPSELVDRIQETLQRSNDPCLPSKDREHSSPPLADPLGRIYSQPDDPPGEGQLETLVRGTIREVLGADADEESEHWFHQLLTRALTDKNLYDALVYHARHFHDKKTDQENRETSTVYYAVGMLFAGDTPGSPLGEFGVASDIGRLAEELRFSLRPVFEPRSSFRELRVRPQGTHRETPAFRSRRGLSPGAGAADPRGGGPQPDTEPSRGGTGN